MHTIFSTSRDCLSAKIAPSHLPGSDRRARFHIDEVNFVELTSSPMQPTARTSWKGARTTARMNNSRNKSCSRKVWAIRDFVAIPAPSFRSGRHPMDKIKKFRDKLTGGCIVKSLWAASIRTRSENGRTPDPSIDTASSADICQTLGTIIWLREKR
jgi:hypothetical protein